MLEMSFIITPQITVVEVPTLTPRRERKDELPFNGLILLPRLYIKDYI